MRRALLRGFGRRRELEPSCDWEGSLAKREGRGLACGLLRKGLSASCPDPIELPIKPEPEKGEFERA
jgi:hypothetical protein